MKQKIQEIVNQYPRHYSRMIKQDKDLREWVCDNSLVETDNFAEMIYSSITQISDECPNGKKYKFNSITTGYRNCGKTGNCKCAKQSVSKKVSSAKSKYNDEKKDQIRRKRNKTNLERYGVINVGQTHKAKDKHRQFYSDNKNVSEVVNKVKRTKLSRYGDESYNNPVKIKSTWRAMAEEYWNSKFPDKDLELLQSKEELSALFETMTIDEIAHSLNVHTQTVYKYLNKHDLRTPFKSCLEQEMIVYLKSLGINNIVCNTRRLLPSKKEIDIYLPDHKLAIEMNGVYWHHEDIPHINRSYHKQKFFECEKMGIQLITVFSSFWKQNPEIVKRTILQKLGLATERIYARNTVIRKVTAKDTRLFLDTYHIQGYTPASVCYQLEYQNRVVAVMTFSKRRIATGKDCSGYELVRYSSSTRVVGGASRLVNAFRKEYPTEDIFSYSNNEWSNGSLYRSIGFRLDREIDVSYWYIDPKEDKLKHRFNYAKQKLVKQGYPAEKTEREITKEMGLLKLWDCGKRRWILDAKT